MTDGEAEFRVTRGFSFRSVMFLILRFSGSKNILGTLLHPFCLTLQKQTLGLNIHLFKEAWI